MQTWNRCVVLHIQRAVCLDASVPCCAIGVLCNANVVIIFYIAKLCRVKNILLWHTLPCMVWTGNDMDAVAVESGAAWLPAIS